LFVQLWSKPLILTLALRLYSALRLCRVRVMPPLYDVLIAGDAATPKNLQVCGAG